MPHPRNYADMENYQMNALVVIFTLYSAPLNVAANEPITMQPATTIEFVATGESAAALKKPWTACERFVKAAQQANMVGYCAAKAE